MTEALDAGRRSYEQRAWQEAFVHLSAEDGCAPLGLEDLERLAVAAHLAGQDAESVAVWGRAHRAALDGGRRLPGRPLCVLAVLRPPPPGRDGTGRRLADPGPARPRRRRRR